MVEDFSQRGHVPATISETFPSEVPAQKPTKQFETLGLDRSTQQGRGFNKKDAAIGLHLYTGR